MAWYDKVIDIATSPIRGARDVLLGDPSEKRAAARAMQSQVDAYKKQTELATSEMERVRGEENAEKRRINEKQIRSTRRGHSNAGFLNNDSGISNTLGG